MPTPALQSGGSHCIREALQLPSCLTSAFSHLPCRTPSFSFNFDSDSDSEPDQPEQIQVNVTRKPLTHPDEEPEASETVNEDDGEGGGSKSEDEDEPGTVATSLERPSLLKNLRHLIQNCWTTPIPWRWISSLLLQPLSCPRHLPWPVTLSSNLPPLLRQSPHDLPPLPQPRSKRPNTSLQQSGTVTFCMRSNPLVRCDAINIERYTDSRELLGLILTSFGCWSF